MDHLPAALCSGCCAAFKGVTGTSARAGYCVLFTTVLIVAELLRDYATPLLHKIPWIGHYAQTPSQEWFGQQAVYRISLGAFLFYGILSAALVNVKTRADPRDKHLHHGNWVAKTFAFVVLLGVPFLFPDDVVYGYTWAARFGSGLFLIVQALILLDFAYMWNDAWVARDSDFWYGALLACTVGSYTLSIALIGLMYKWFKPDGAGPCSLNMWLVTLTLFIVLGLSAVALHPAAGHRGSLFPASIVGLYCTFLCYSALASEPYSEPCNGLAHSKATSQSALVGAMAVTLLSVVYSAVRAGSTSGLLSTSDDGDDGGPTAREEDSEVEAPLVDRTDGEEGDQAMSRECTTTQSQDSRPPAYSYSFFHLIFALASMYIAMLMTGWGTVDLHASQLDVSWTSVWVKMATCWLVAALYGWSLVAPTVLPDRDFS